MAEIPNILATLLETRLFLLPLMTDQELFLVMMAVWVVLLLWGLEVLVLSLIMLIFMETKLLVWHHKMVWHGAVCYMPGLTA